MTKIETMLEAAKLQARTVIIDGGGALAPTWILVDAQGEIQIEMTPWEDDFEKMIAEMFIKLKMKRLKTVAYSFLVESWMAKMPIGWKPGDPHVQPSERPDRSECVVAFATDGRDRRWAVMDIKRDAAGKATSLEPFQGPMDGIEGWMAHMLDEKQ
jgi:hypothetical protein